MKSKFNNQSKTIDVSNVQVKARPSFKNVLQIFLATIFTCLVLIVATACGDSGPKSFDVTLPVLDMPGWYIIEPLTETKNLKKGTEFSFKLTYDPEIKMFLDSDNPYIPGNLGIEVKANGKKLNKIVSEELNDAEYELYTVTINQNTTITIENLPRWPHYVTSISNLVSVQIKGKQVNVGDMIFHGDVLEIFYYSRPGYGKPTLTVTSAVEQSCTETRDGYLFKFVVTGIRDESIGGILGGVNISADVTIECEEHGRQFTLGEIPDEVRVTRNGEELTSYATIYYEDMLTIQPKEEMDGYNQIITVTGCYEQYQYCYKVVDNVTISYTIEDGPTWNKFSYSLNYPEKRAEIRCSSHNISGRVVIPSQYKHYEGDAMWSAVLNDKNGYNEGAFEGCAQITEVVLQEGITKIPARAFAGCCGITRIILPKSLTEIEDDAFEDCNIVEIINNSSLELELGSLTYGSIAQNACVILKDISQTGDFNIVENGIKYYENSLYNISAVLGFEDENDSRTQLSFKDNTVCIFANAFADNENITKVDLPDGLKVIGCKAFSNLVNSIDINLPDSIISIEASAFTGCKMDTALPKNLKYIGEDAFAHTALTNVEIPGGVEIIEAGAFFNSNITSLTFNKGLKSIENMAFGMLDDLRSPLILPEGLESVGDSAFYFSWYVPKISIPSTLVHFGENAFNECSSSSTTPYDLILPEGLTSLPVGVFSSCNIRSVTLPSTLTRIDNGAFFNHNLFEVVNNSPLQLEKGATTNGSVAQYAHIIVNVKAGEQKGEFFVEKGVSYYNNPSLNMCLALRLEDETETDIILNDSTTEVFKQAFLNSDIKSVTMPSTLKYIAEKAFSGCKNLTELINLSNSQLTTIGDNAFSYCSNLTNPTFPNCLTIIDGAAFAQCKNITSLTFPNGLTTIGNSAFSGCENLTSINIPNKITIIDGFAFNECSNLQGEIDLPEGLTTLGYYSFYGTKITSVTLPHSVENLDNAVFSNCENLISVKLTETAASQGILAKTIPSSFVYKCTSLTNFEMPNNITQIGASAFSGCVNLQLSTLPETLTTIYSSAFSECNFKDYTLNLPNLKSIGYQAFYKCGGLISVDLSSVSMSADEEFVIDKNAFEECLDLVNVILPEGLKVIEEKAFYLCPKLASVVLPHSITWLNKYAFNGCVRLHEVVNETGLEFSDLEDKYNKSFINWNLYYYFTNRNQKGTFFVENGIRYYENSNYCEGYIALGYDDDFDERTELKFKANTTAIEKQAFNNSINMYMKFKNIIFPDGLKTIGEQAFAHSRVQSITLPYNLESIGSSAFNDCRELTTITSTKAKDYYYDANVVVNIGESAFEGCTNLTDLALPNDNKITIEKRAFYGCTVLTNFEVPAGLISIGDEAFSSCKNLQGLTLPYLCQTIGKNAFKDCSNITSLKFEQNLTQIGDYAFQNCTSLTEIIPLTEKAPLQQNLEFKIGNYAFKNCNVLANLILPENTVSIGNEAFYNCALIQTVTLPEKLKSLGSNSFSGCLWLREVVNKSSVYSNSITSSGITSRACAVLTEESQKGIFYIEGHVRYYESEYLEKTLALGLDTAEDVREINIKEGTTDIADRAFSGCVSLQTVIMADTVTIIGEYAFQGCTNLTYIKLSEALTTIGKGAFDATGLTSITIPADVESIDFVFDSDAFDEVIIEGSKLLERINTISRLKGMLRISGTLKVKKDVIDKLVNVLNFNNYPEFEKSPDDEQYPDYYVYTKISDEL